MSDRPAKRDDAPAIDFSEVARTEKPDAPSLAEERAERDRARRAENDAAAGDRPEDRPLPVTPIPPD